MELNYGKHSEMTAVNFYEKKGLQCLFLAAVCITLLGCGLKSDKKLERTFNSNSADFNQLIRMCSVDSDVTVIRPDLTALDSGRSGKPAGLSEKRWDEYRRIFKKLGLREGLEHREEYSAIFFVADGSGPVTASSYKGYAYSERSLSPVLNSLDSKWLSQDLYDSKGHAIAFKRIRQNWYLYREQY